MIRKIHIGSERDDVGLDRLEDGGDGAVGEVPLAERFKLSIVVPPFVGKRQILQRTPTPLVVLELDKGRELVMCPVPNVLDPLDLIAGVEPRVALAEAIEPIGRLEQRGVDVFRMRALNRVVESPHGEDIAAHHHPDVHESRGAEFGRDRGPTEDLDFSCSDDSPD